MQRWFVSRLVDDLQIVLERPLGTVIHCVVYAIKVSGAASILRPPASGSVLPGLDVEDNRAHASALTQRLPDNSQNWPIRMTTLSSSPATDGLVWQALAPS